MKKIKYLLALAIMLTVGLATHADNDRVITFQELPAPAQELIKAHFGDKVPMVVTMDMDDYEVYFESGEKIEFRKNGDWKEIVCKTSNVPSMLIPDAIKGKVKASYPAAVIVKIERDRRGYDVKLNNGVEIEMDNSFNVISIDR